MNTDIQTWSWKVEHYSGGQGYRAGFYVYRYVNGSAVWMQTKNDRARRFTSLRTAQVAIEADLKKRVQLIAEKT